MEWDLSINPSKCSCLAVGSLPPLPSFFLRQTPIIRSPWWTASETLGFPLTRLSTRKCIADSANIARRLLFMGYRSFSKRSRTASISLYYAIIWTHLGHEMEPRTWKLELAIWRGFNAVVQRLVRGIGHVPHEETLHQPNLFSLERRRPSWPHAGLWHLT